MICAIALLSALTALQDRDSVTAVVREDPGDGKPRIVCEGTAGLPEGSRLDLRIYYGPVEPGRELEIRTARVRAGAFSREFLIFPEKNLAGSYALKVTHLLDSPGRPWSRLLPFRIGALRDGERDRAEVLERLARDIREIAALADDLDRERSSSDVFRQAWRIAERARKSPECRALRLEEVSGAGLLDLCNRLQAVAAGAAAARAAPEDPRLQASHRQARSAFDRAARKHLDRLASEQISGEALRGLAEEIGRKLTRVAGLTGESLEASRKEFTAALLRLQVKAPARHHAALVGLASKALALFDESRSREERESGFHHEVEPEIARLMEEFSRNRWE